MDDSQGLAILRRYLEILLEEEFMLTGRFAHPLFAWLMLLFFITGSHAGFANSEVHYSHGLSRFDTLKYPENFTHFDYVYPEAPKGGEIRLYTHGTFDSLNPYTISGTSPSWIPTYSYLKHGFSELNEPLMVGSGSYSPSGDEIKTAYGLIAESVEYPDDNRWIIFNLRPEARFHDGKPITADDVVFSFHSLKENGHPRYKMQLDVIKHVEKLSSSKVRFTFKNAGNRTQLFRAAELPVLPSHFWKDKTLGKSSLTAPLNSGPYQISKFQPGSFITFTRVKDYWGKDLPVNKGRYNFDSVTIYFYRDLSSAFEAFKAGNHDLHPEVIAKNWHMAYDFPAIKKGLIKRSELQHQLAMGSSFFFFNTRRAPFDDIRVRMAVSLMFDFEWTNKALFYNAYRRGTSYFNNTYLASAGLPSEAERQWLLPWKNQLPEPLFTKPFEVSVTNGDGNIRNQQRQATQLLKSAGWSINNGKMLNEKTGKQLTFTFVDDLSVSHRYILPIKKNLEAIGIDMVYQEFNSAQYYQRVRSLDFDMIEHILPQTHAPDIELQSYFHSSVANNSDTLNLAGIQNPVVDDLVEKVPDAKTQEDMKALIHSLDRVLLWNYYGIPKWHSSSIRAAYRDVFGWPEQQPIYTTPFSTWWRKDVSLDKDNPMCDF